MNTAQKCLRLMGQFVRAILPRRGAVFCRGIAVAVVFAALPALAEDVRANHSVLPSGYTVACTNAQTLTITNTFEFPTNETLIAMTWTPILPPGWVLSTNTWGDGCGPAISTNDATIVFVSNPLPTKSPITFNYQVIVPANESGVKSLNAVMTYWFYDADDPTEIAVTPNPLPLKMLLKIGGNFAAADKVYDGTKAATISATNLTLIGVLAGEEGGVVLNPAAEFASPDVGTHQVFLTTNTIITGSAADHYVLSLADAPATNATIISGAAGVGAYTCAGYYSPSTNMAVSNTFTYPAGQTLTQLVWSPLLPAGWTLRSATGDNSVVVGANITFPVIPTNRPVKFTYTVNVPGNAAVSNELGGSVSYCYQGSAGNSVALNTLTVFRYHSADAQAPTRKLDGAEVNRVLAYWRAGGYCPRTATSDGYAPTNSYNGDTSQGLHSADYQSAWWQIDADEASRALSYWRADGYHADANGFDGYAANRVGPGPMVAFNGATAPAVVLTGPATYRPGETLTITASFSYGDATLLGLVWKPQVPTGWTVVSVSGDGSPDLVRGEVLCVGALPQRSLQLVYTVQTPASETRVCAFGMTASYMANGMVNPVALNASAITISPFKPIALSSDLALNDMVFLPVNVTNLSPAGTVSFRLNNFGPDSLNAADLAFDFYMAASNGVVVWIGSFQRKINLAVGEEVPIVLTAAERQSVVIRSGMRGVYQPSVTVRNLDAINDPNLANNTAWGVGRVTVKAKGPNSAGRANNDYDGDGRADCALLNVGQGVWCTAFSAMRYTQSGYQATRLYNWRGVPGDYDGDGLCDMGFYNPLNGSWCLQFSSDREIIRGQFGGPEFEPTSVDWNGDGRTDPVVYRVADGYWVGLQSVVSCAIGEGWVTGRNPQPVPADYDGDLLADPVVYLESTGQWIGGMSASDYQFVAINYGGVGFKGVPADYDGDGRADMAVYAASSGIWYVALSGQDYLTVSAKIGGPGNLPVVADYDGDGKADPAVYQQSSGLWRIYLSSQGYACLYGYYGGPDYQPVCE